MPAASNSSYQAMFLALDSSGVVTGREVVTSIVPVFALIALLIVLSFYLGKAVQKRGGGAADQWSRGDVIGLLRLIVALVAIALSLFNPEVRKLLGFF